MNRSIRFLVRPLAVAVALSCAPLHAADSDGDGLPDDLEAAWGRDAQVKDNDIFTSPSLFAMQQYRDLLAREADSGGLINWANNIRNNALTREQMIEQFIASAEFQGRIAPVTRLYFAYFNRVPDSDGLAFWTSQATAGTPLGSISDAFAQSEEFRATYGALDNTGFVNRVYQNVLERNADAGGLAFWRGELDAGRISRGGVMVQFSESPEYQAKIGAAVTVTMVYFGMLRRSPDPGGFDYWRQQLAGGASLQGLVSPFFASAEYRTRFLGSDPVARSLALKQDAARFLAQTSFGVVPAELARVQDRGVPQYLEEQLAMPVTGYPAFEYFPPSQPSTCRADSSPTSAASLCARDNYSLFAVQNAFFRNAMTGPDQLRQRVAFALSQIMVTSGLEVNQAYAMRNYQQMLTEQAFGNFRTLLEKVTLSPMMGRYLDMANNSKAYTVGSGATAVTVQPNENYARELLQLFAWGVWELNPDGTYRMANGLPIASYENDEVREYARALTGWTYAPRPGVTSRWTNAVNYEGDLVPDPNTNVSANQHDRTAKTLIASSVCPAGTARSALPANQTAPQDLQDTITNIFCHPNVGPFIGRQLIQHLVTSNPSPAYVARVTAAFDNNGQGVRGDLKAVLRAILLDAEARSATRASGDYGKLKEPVLLVTSFVRSLGGFSDGLYLRQQAQGMGQNLFYSPSVFNYYPAEYVIPATDLDGPQFGILNASTSFSRANFFYNMTFNAATSGNPDSALAGATGSKIDPTRFTALAGSPASLIDAVADLMIPGQMTPQLRDALLPAVNAISMTASNGPLDRVRTAIYLLANSPQFTVDR